MTSIPLLLWCPECGERHIDYNEWATREHRTHECHKCGMRWAPAAVPTVGVEKLPNEETAKLAVCVCKTRGLPDYHTMLGQFCTEFEVPGSPTWQQALEYVKARLR